MLNPRKWNPNMVLTSVPRPSVPCKRRLGVLVPWSGPLSNLIKSGWDSGLFLLSHCVICHFYCSGSGNRAGLCRFTGCCEDDRGNCEWEWPTPVSASQSVCSCRHLGEYVFSFENDGELSSPAWGPQSRKKTGVSLLFAVEMRYTFGWGRF